jgi:ribulose-5-phosphate 4-epimerase/fuculose-1-phosphate aldolase
MAKSEGIIQYVLHFDDKELAHGEVSNDLIHFRNQLAKQQLIGVYNNGISYGNISERVKVTNRFVISGTQTGWLKTATAKDFCMVTGFSISENILHCTGTVKASSEALTHAAFYSAHEYVQAVIHVHHFQLWEKLLYQVDTVEKSITYGSVAMAESVSVLIRKNAHGKKILVTAGHAEGIFTYGKSLQEAYDVLMHFAQMTYY